MSAVSYKKDLHAILGVAETAGPDELRRAYLALAVKYHPDRNPGDPKAEERFKDISQAYAVLSDPAARARYERLRPKKPAAAKGTAASAAGRASSAARPAGGSASAAGKGSAQGADRAKPASGGAKASGAGAGPAGSGGAERGPAKGASFSSGGSASQSSSPNNNGGFSSGGPAGGSASSSSTFENRGPEGAEADFDEILAGFFKSDKGRETLRDLEGELGKAGLKFRAEDFARWVKEKGEPRPAPAAPGQSFWQRLLARLPGAEARARKKAGQYDINYQITITPEVAAAGTTVEISYQRDERPNRLAIKIPAGIKNGAKLRLAEQGRMRPGQASRGDLILAVTVAQPPKVADLWR